MRVLLLALLATASCATAPIPDPREARAEAALQVLIQRGFVGSVLVACGDDVMFAGDYGLGDLEGRAPSYWLASLTKSFTAVAILQLAEAGRLSLDDPLSRFFPDAPADKAGITMFQLLTHQSGLRHTYAAEGVADRAGAARAIFAQQTGAAPGSSFIYSSDNYSLLAMIVEIASAERYEEFVRARQLAPAGMSDTGFWPETGEDFTPSLMAPPSGAVAAANWGYRGGFGMRASVEDLHRWMRVLLAGRLLSPQSQALMFGPHTQARDGDGVGAGWFWTETPEGARWLWTRGYDTSGANAVLYRLWGTPLVVIAATNAGPAEAAGPGWSRQARDALMQIYDAEACSE